MAGLISAIEEVEGDAVFVPMSARFDNTLGTPLVSADANFSGEELADIYTLTFTSVIAETSATVHVSSASGNNPYDGRSKAILLDGTTVYGTVIGGTDLVFSDDAGFLGTWTAEIRTGHSFGSFNAFPPDAGTASDPRQIQVENTGAANGTSCKARLLPVVKRYRKTGQVFARVKPFAESAVEKLTGSQIVPYAITVSGVSGSGGSKTMDVRVDTVAFNVINLTDSTTGTSDDLNVVDFYRITSGDLEDVTFQLSENAVNSDAENLLIFEHRFSQIAPDVAGTPGSFDTTDVDLTESGQSTGTITPSGLAYYWVRMLVPEGGNSDSNPFQCSVAIQGAAASPAGWSD